MSAVLFSSKVSEAGVPDAWRVRQVDRRATSISGGRVRILGRVKQRWRRVGGAGEGRRGVTTEVVRVVELDWREVEFCVHVWLELDILI